jgi:hypothetical protein
VKVLSDRALGRALLARQGLLERRSVPVLDELERLVALQAQVPRDPYIGLWARLEGFDPHELSALVEQRAVVRGGILRPTIHLATARDALVLAALNRPLMSRTWRAYYLEGLGGADVEEVVRVGGALLHEQPLTRAELGRRLRKRWPDAAPDSLGAAVTCELAVLQVPPRGLWGRSGQARFALVEDWLGAPPDPDASVDDVILRYLRAYGPASVADARVWCGWNGLREVFERLRPRLRTFRDTRGRELFDVPDGVLVDEDTPAPPRLLGQYDNAMIAHKDRTRIGLERGLVQPSGAGIGNVLVDGVFAGLWRVRDGRLVLDVVHPGNDLLAEAGALAELLGVEPPV